MTTINNNIAAKTVNFGSLPYFARGTYVDKSLLMARDAEYGKILDGLEKDTFEPVDVILAEVDETKSQDAAPSLEDIEAARKLHEMLLELRNSDPLQQPPPSYRSGYTYGPRLLDIRA